MFESVASNVFVVGGSDLSHPSDGCVAAVDLDPVVLIDCGCGPGWQRIRRNLAEAGFEAGEVGLLVLTHAHVDHIGAVREVQDASSCRVIAHALDAEAIECGDPLRTASNWYGIELPRVLVDERVEGPVRALELPGGTLHLMHTPGHTPGSMVAWLDTPDAGRVLFGQDIHGPFHDAFGSDIGRWRRSMERLLDLEADVLCEGHYGIYFGKERVRRFIEEQLERFEP